MASPNASSVVTVPVHRTADGTLTINIDAEMVPEAERRFAVVCARAAVRHGSPQLQLAQLDPLGDAIARLVVVRFTRERFIERARTNEVFRLQLEEQLAQNRGVPGMYSELVAAGAAAGSPPTSATWMIDAEVELASFSGTRASMVFLASSGAGLALLAKGKLTTTTFFADLEATMSTQVLADLMLSWKTVAGSLEAAT